jgi:thioredoxin reductase
MQNHKVVIIGAGPTGLSAARHLKAQGLNDVVVLEREVEAGGIPRYCGHWGFGWESHRRLMTGPKYANVLREGLDVRTATTVLEFTLRASMRIHSAVGISELSADRILLAMGARESSRASRLIGGAKPSGVINTGTLQQMVYQQNHRPFLRPVIIGSEWVSYSALMTCRHAGIKPVCMIEENFKPEAPQIFRIGAKMVFGVGISTNTRLLRIIGGKAVEAVEVETNGSSRLITCDGVIVTGKLRPESSLYAGGFLERDGEALRIFENFRTSNPKIFAAGNLLGNLKTAGSCAVQGKAAAEAILKDLV